VTRTGLSKQKALTYDSIAVFSRCLEPLTKQTLKFQKRFPIHTPQHFDIFRWQLEWCSLKTYVTWRIGQHEPKVYVNEVPLSVQQYVPIMPILYLQQVRYDGITYETGRALNIEIEVLRAEQTCE
jgi:hypothetical protein